MGKKEDEAADFLEKMLSGNVKITEINDENNNATDRFQKIMDENEIRFDKDMEDEYQAYLKKTDKQGWGPISRAEFLAVRHTTSGSRNN